MSHPRGNVLIAASVLLSGIGCASMSGSRPISWESVPRSGQTNGVAVIENDQLVLENREIRTANAYSTPVTIECEVSPDTLTFGVFVIKFVPSDAQSVSGELGRQFILGAASSSNHAAFTEFAIASSQGPGVLMRNVWEKRWGGNWLTLKPGALCHVSLSLSRDQLGIALNGSMFAVKGAGVPYEKFHIELSCLGAGDRWRVRKFSIH
jgi:hypothetical protein